MGFFKRAKKHSGDQADSSDAAASHEDPALDSSTGLVSSVLTRRSDSGEPSRFDGIVERQYGPGAKERLDSGPKANRDGDDPDTSEKSAAAADSDDLAMELDSDSNLHPTLEIDSCTRIGSSTIFAGKIVADEDLEVHGTVEGSIALDQHQLTVGVGGVVQADVEANAVLVIGRITGDVTATDVVEVKTGGYIGGDVMAPRIIMNDGAIVVGALDMTEAIPKDLERHEPTTSPPKPKATAAPPVLDPSSDEAD